MAKSGRDGFMSTLAGGHDFVFDFCCGFCGGEGQQKEAIGYCSDCREYLCAECFKTHLRPKPSRNHQLLDQQQMPKDQQQNIGTGGLSATLKGGCDYIYEYCCDLCEGEGQQKEAVGYCSDCREYLCTDCFNHHTRPKPSRHHILLDQYQMPKDTKSPTANTKKESVPVSDVESRMSRISLQQDSDVRKTHAQHIRDVDVRFGVDRFGRDIAGCVILPGDKLVLVDNNNGKVKLAYLSRNVLLKLISGDVVSQLELPGIWDITKVSSVQVAITSPHNNMLVFVNVGDKLGLERKVKVKGWCWGISCISDNLVVSYTEPLKVEILSTRGEVLQTVVTEDKGRELFTTPWFIAVSKDQQTIYISDSARDTITSVDLTGRVLATYKDTHMLEYPQGLTIDTVGTVYVCGIESMNVIQLTTDLTEGRELLQQSDGIRSPMSVCYCQATDRLYVGMGGSDVVKVFQMK